MEKVIENKHKEKRISEKDIIIVIAIATVIVLAFFVYVNFIPKPSGKISVEVIRISGCEDCFDISQFNPLEKATDVEIKKESTLNYSSPEAKKLISKYNIKKVPALIIISRNIEKIELDSNAFRKEKNAAIFDRAVPYINLESGETKGIVDIKEVYDSGCIECRSLSGIKAQLEAAGVKINKYESISSSLDMGKELIKDNSISFLPTLLISKEIREYWWVFDNLKNSLTETADYYKFNEPVFPYKDLLTNKTKGIVRIIYLSNKSCEDCFNITQIKSSFQGIGVYINSESNVDVADSEGKNLLSRYNITAIPTVILSKEISDYGSIKSILEGIGTFEADNRFVLRALDKLNVKYQRLT